MGFLIQADHCNTVFVFRRKDGLIEEAWGFKPTPENTHVFLCGAPIMINSVLPILKAEGFKEHTKDNPGQIHMEKFDI